MALFGRCLGSIIFGARRGIAGARGQRAAALD